MKYLQKRLRLAGTILVGLSYFLPWATIMSPFGSIELRGIYVDYAWVLPVLAILRLVLQFVKTKKDEFEFAAPYLQYINVVDRITPLVFVGFFTWYGANFLLNVHNASVGKSASFFGTTLDSMVKAGLDYGFWAGACGAVSLVIGVVCLEKQVAKQLVYTAATIASVGFLAFVVSRPSSHAQRVAAGPLETAHETASAPTPPRTEFDSSSFVQVTSISARELAKDYEASRYSNEIVISPVFKNGGSRAIVGLRGRLSVIDGFGKEIYGFSFRDDDKILPGQDSGHGGYRFEENTFAHDDPYHRMI